MSRTTYFDGALQRTDHRMMTKWQHYFDIYARELGHLEGRDVSFLEIGIFKGGSIPMWTGFFGAGARMTFADIDPGCAQLGEPSSTIEIGDQTDPEFLAQLGKTHGPFDVVIDDGGHMMDQQKTSFAHLWPYLKDGGLYLVEDTHTSYWPGFGGGFRDPASFVEFAKRLVDRMHSWYTDQDDIFPFDPIAKELDSVRFYDSIIVLEKARAAEPPLTVTSTDGKITRSRRALEVRGRGSVFARPSGQ